MAKKEPKTSEFKFRCSPQFLERLHASAGKIGMSAGNWIVSEMLHAIQLVEAATGPTSEVADGEDGQAEAE